MLVTCPTLVQVGLTPKETCMLTLFILALVTVPVAIDLGTRRRRQTIALSMQHPRP